MKRLRYYSGALAIFAVSFSSTASAELFHKDVASASVAVNDRDERASLVSRWKANGNVKDSEKASPLGRLVHGSYDEGVHGLAFRLGDKSYVTIPNDDSQNITGPLSVSARVRLKSLSGGQTIIGKYNTFDKKTSYWFGLNEDGALQLTISGDCDSIDGNYRILVATGNPMVANKWQLVAAEFDPRTQDMKIFVEGELVQSQLDEGSQEVDSICQSEDPLRFGLSTLYDGQVGGHLHGRLDDVSLYSGLAFS